MANSHDNTDSMPLLDVRLASGRRIWCSQYLVCDTYGGFLEGRPSPDRDRAMVAAAEREAKRVFHDAPVRLLEPVRASASAGYQRRRFTALFSSLPINREMHLSSLVLIWFQDEQFPAMDEATLSAVRALEWDRLAKDHEI